LALEYVLLKYGFPLAYYVDSHSIFRFVQERDSFWRNHYQLTDGADPQWKQVLDDCRVTVFKVKDLYVAALEGDCTRLTYLEILKDKKASILIHLTQSKILSII
jgi:hypothetical protein